MTFHREEFVISCTEARTSIHWQSTMGGQGGPHEVVNIMVFPLNDVIALGVAQGHKPMYQNAAQFPLYGPPEGADELTASVKRGFVEGPLSRQQCGP